MAKILTEVWDMSRGFLSANDPIIELPRAFTALDQFGAELPKLLAAEAVGKQVRNLPIFDLSGANREIAERAMMLYSFIGQAYVWEEWRENKPRGIIPTNIAVPWYALAEMLGREPILSYASYALYNWRRIEKKGHVVLGNICLLQNFYGGLDEEWFILPHVAIEREAILIVLSGTLMMESVRKKDMDGTTSFLGSMRIGLKNVNEVMSRMPDGCDPYIYYNRVRPFIQGWKSDAQDAPLPPGIIYEGVEKFAGEPQRFRGETGAQSTIVPSLDAFFGVVHADWLPDGSPDILKGYLLDMRNYMPKEHREFLNDLEVFAEKYSLRGLISKNKNNAGLKETYNACLEELVKFSDMHYDYATRYIHRQVPKGANPTETGTGGTPFMKYLKKHRDERLACLVV